MNTASDQSSELHNNLFAHGIALDPSPEKFGFLRETAATATNSVLHQRMDEDGYLYIREFWCREKVQGVRDAITHQLADLGFLKPGTVPDEARFNGREVGRAMGNPLNQRESRLRDLVFGPRIMEFFQAAPHVTSILFGSGPRGLASAVPSIATWFTWVGGLTIYTPRGFRLVMSIWR